jgi:hypothetical protein
MEEGDRAGRYLLSGLRTENNGNENEDRGNKHVEGNQASGEAVRKYGKKRVRGFSVTDDNHGDEAMMAKKEVRAEIL